MSVFLHDALPGALVALADWRLHLPEHVHNCAWLRAVAMFAVQDGAEDIESRSPSRSLSYVNAAPQLGTLREEVAESASGTPQLPGTGAARSVIPLPELPPPHLVSLLTILLAPSVFLHET